MEPPAVQEELVKSPTFHNFADLILHNIVVKDIFAWVYLVSTEQITNRVSLEIGIGYNSSEMDRDRYSGNCLFKVEAGNEEEEEVQKKDFVWRGRNDEPPVLLSLACMFGEALKRMEKKLGLKKLILVTSEFLIPPAPPPPSPSKKVLKVYIKMS